MPAMNTLKIATYNIHKGFSQFNRRFVLHELRERLQELNADIVFLQEVQGAHQLHGARHANYPAQPQHEFLAAETWLHHAYGMNSAYDDGHHGNAILSRFPIVRWDNQDVSAHRFESRGILHCEISIPQSDTTLHCLCVHFGLFKRGRGVQFEALVARILREVPSDAPLIIAGDFNDWNNHAQRLLEQELGLREVFEKHTGKLARSYPARLPMFRLDRIYVRGLEVLQGHVHARHPWDRISDHAALSAVITLP
jgi:endonuclease/exonuclease/phosphatase family metal-dependent hydrolase